MLLLQHILATAGEAIWKKSLLNCANKFITEFVAIKKGAVK